MPRYQLVNRSYTRELDIEATKRFLKAHGFKQVRDAYPDMGTWRGTNQPRCVTFTSASELSPRQEIDLAELHGGRVIIETRRAKL